VGVTGASGVEMSYYLLKALRSLENMEIFLILSEGAKLTWELECGRPLRELCVMADYVLDNANLAACISSGSFVTDGMIVMPCSMKTLAGIVNSLKLKDAEGNALTLDGEGHGSFEELVKKYIISSAQWKLDHPGEEIRQMPVPESDIRKQDSLTIVDGKVTAVDLSAYVKTITRMKKTPAFDAVDLRSPENEEFGTETVFARHFTNFSKEHSEVNGDMAEEKVIKMLNPTCYIGEADTAKFWRIRHGSFDRDTSLAIPVILAVMLENAGYQVDFRLPWGLPHSGDYDLPQLFAWIDEICLGDES